MAKAREEAVTALHGALETTPAAASAEAVHAAIDALDRGHHALVRAGRRGRGVDEALAVFAYAGRYAEAVPDVVAAVTDVPED